MSLDHHDDLLARVHRADPTAGDLHATHTGHAAPAERADAGRAAVTAARARRGARTRLGAGAGIGGLAAVATAVVVALGATTAGPVAAKPRARQIVARAAQATSPEPNTIVMIDSRRDVRWSGGGRDGGLFTRGTGFVLFDEAGRMSDNRRLVTDTSGGERLPAGLDDATSWRGGEPVHQTYDPVAREDSRQERAWSVPSPVFQTHTLFARAQRGDAQMRLLGQTTVDGRLAWRLLVTGADEEPLDGDRDELLVDAASYEPVELRRHTEHVRAGVRYTNDSVERIYDYRVLPDTPANRELLKLHGPIRPAE